MGRLNSTSTVGNQGYKNLSKLSHSNRLNNKSGKSCASQNYLKMYHQNIYGLKSKINELLSSLYPNLPHIICMSEYHLKYAEINNIVTENYMIGASYCRHYAMKGGTCIFIPDNIKFDRVNLDKYCADFDIEICAVRIQNESSYIYVLSVYRAPSGNFNNFMLKMDEVLKSLYTLKTEFILCDDFNIDYLMDNYEKKQLSSLLNTYNLFSTVVFPTRITSITKSAFDNIFVYYSRMGKFGLSPMYNGISNHVAQIMLFHDITIIAHNKCAHMLRNIDEYSLLNFNNNLSFELWEDVFDENGANFAFQTFLNTFIRYFYNSFHISFTRPHKSYPRNRPWRPIGL
jgi:hypothetical protein